MSPHQPRFAALAGVLLALVAPGVAHARDWYVDPTAVTGGDGSQSRPFHTIADALTGLSRGDTVWLATGTYPEVVNIASLPGAGTTTFRALPGATPVIDGTNGSSSAQFVVQTSVPNVTFQDLTITNAMNGALGIQFYHADGGQVLHCTTRNMSSNAVTFYYSSHGLVSDSTFQGNIAGRQTMGTVVEHNEVYGSSAEGVGLYDGSTDCTVAHNVIHDNFSVNLYLDSISHSTFDGNLIYETNTGNDLEGIEISDEGHYTDLPAPVNAYNTIINNVIVNHNLGIVFWSSGQWATQALNDQSGLRHDVIANNTLVNNLGSIKWDASPAHVGTIIANNVIVAAAGSGPLYLLYGKSTAGITLDHNLWFAPDLAQPFLWVTSQTDHAGWVTASGQGAGDVLTNPTFAGTWTVPPAAHLALAMASPAIGVGVPLSAVTDDFLGATRPATGPDLGAFQSGATAPGDAGIGPSPDGAMDATRLEDTNTVDVGRSRDVVDAGAHGGSSGCSCSLMDRGIHGGDSRTTLAWLIVALAVGRRRNGRADAERALAGPRSTTPTTP